MRGGNGSLPWFPIYFDALLDSYLIKGGGRESGYKVGTRK